VINMKLYNITPTRLKFEWGEMDCVTLGERGRARKQVIIPFHAPPPSGEDADYYEIGATKSGNPKIIKGHPSKGYIAHISTYATYTRGSIGYAYFLQEDRDKLEIIAEGIGAFGDAGRLGGWYDYLLVVKSFPCRILVTPSGGRHKVSWYWLVFTEEKVYKVNLEEAAAFVEATGIDIPVEEDDKKLFEKLENLCYLSLQKQT
jgi:hypothetical protein